MPISVGLLAIGGLYTEIAVKSSLAVMHNLSACGFIFVMISLLLHKNLERFLAAAAKAVPTTADEP